MLTPPLPPLPDTEIEYNNGERLPGTLDNLTSIVPPGIKTPTFLYLRVVNFASVDTKVNIFIETFDDLPDPVPVPDGAGAAPPPEPLLPTVEVIEIVVPVVVTVLGAIALVGFFMVRRAAQSNVMVMHAPTVADGKSVDEGGAWDGAADVVKAPNPLVGTPAYAFAPTPTRGAGGSARNLSQMRAASTKNVVGDFA